MFSELMPKAVSLRNLRPWEPGQAAKMSDSAPVCFGARERTHGFGLCFRLYRGTTNPKTASTRVKITNSESAILNSRLLLMSGHTARARSNSTRSHRFVRMTPAIDFPLVNSRRPLRHGQPISDWGAQTGEPQNYVLANTGNCGESQDWCLGQRRVTPTRLTHATSMAMG